MRNLSFSVAALALAAAPLAAQSPAACCSITAIDAATGVITARVTANGNVFQFKVTDAGALASLKVGQGVFANIGGRQVSLDGRRACCAITSGPSAPAAAPAPRAPVAPPPAAVPPAPPPRAVPAAPLARISWPNRLRMDTRCCSSPLRW